ncbi:MAG: hypothetical protein JRI23_22400 [Deltaproteobacteria bacterium]|jgi:hypothetical protein|nr:hypothetical protein [Deltaproteobacteria bacterium]MBW2534698.1 hypothetical protein [Deltaproteobacteria bacterium]
MSDSPHRLAPRLVALAAAGAMGFAAPSVEASDAAVGLAPVAVLPALSVIGGGVTTIWIGSYVADDEPVLTDVRTAGIVFGGLNVALGTTGIILGATLDTSTGMRAAAYSVGGAVAALGVTGLGLSLAVETREPNPVASATSRVAVAPLLTPWQKGMTITGVF